MLIKGRPCRKGHTLRYRNGVCAECSRTIHLRYRVANRAKINRRQSLKRRPDPDHAKPECCEICRLKARRLVADHSHFTGKARGWLCDRCNTAIGSLRDDFNIASLASDYLIEWVVKHGGK